MMSERARTISIMRRSKYTAEVLGPIVASSRSYSEVLRRLGLSVTGGNHRLISARIRQAKIDTSHFFYGRARGERAGITSELLEQLVGERRSVAKVLAKLDLPTDGRAHHELSRRISDLGLDTSHFRGQGWARGETRNSHPSLEAGVRKRELRNEDVFVENGPYLSGTSLARRLSPAGLGLSLCVVRDHRVARDAPRPAPRSHQRHQ
jgi:hypothetical protein